MCGNKCSQGERTRGLVHGIWKLSRKYNEKIDDAMRQEIDLCSGRCNFGAFGRRNQLFDVVQDPSPTVLSQGLMRHGDGGRGCAVAIGLAF